MLQTSSIKEQQTIPTNRHNSLPIKVGDILQTKKSQ